MGYGLSFSNKDFESTALFSGISDERIAKIQNLYKDSLVKINGKIKSISDLASKENSQNDNFNIIVNHGNPYTQAFLVQGIFDVNSWHYDMFARDALDEKMDRLTRRTWQFEKSPFDYDWLGTLFIPGNASDLEPDTPVVYGLHEKLVDASEMWDVSNKVRSNRRRSYFKLEMQELYDILKGEGNEMIALSRDSASERTSNTFFGDSDRTYQVANLIVGRGFKGKDIASTDSLKIKGIEKTIRDSWRI